MTSPWTYDPKSRRYRGPRGRYIGPDGMRELRSAFIASLYDDANKVTGRLARQEITLNEGLAEARQLVAATWIDNYIISRGGRKRMTPKDWGLVGSKIKAEYGHLQKLFQGVQDNTVSEAQLARRLRAYMDAGKEAYALGERVAAREAGKREAMSVRHALDSCDGCIREAAKGWTRPELISPPGTRDCLRNCLCEVVYR